MNSSSLTNQQDEDDDEYLEEEEESSSQSSESKSLWNLIFYIIATLLGGFVFMGRSSPLRYLFTRLFSNSSSPSSSSNNNSPSSFFDKLFASPFLDDDERVRLRPISVNSYVHVYPTLQNEDGVFVKVFIENSSELATENV